METKKKSGFGSHWTDYLLLVAAGLVGVFAFLVAIIPTTETGTISFLSESNGQTHIQFLSNSNQVTCATDLSSNLKIGQIIKIHQDGVLAKCQITVLGQ